MNEGGLHIEQNTYFKKTAVLDQKPHSELAEKWLEMWRDQLHK